MSNGNTLHPSQQESEPSTRKTMKTDQNSTQPRKATVLLENKKFNKHQIHPRKKLKYVYLTMDCNIVLRGLLTSYLTNLVIETERAIKLPDTKLQNIYHFMVAKKLEQTIS